MQDWLCMFKFVYVHTCILVWPYIFCTFFLDSSVWPSDNAVGKGKTFFCRMLIKPSGKLHSFVSLLNFKWTVENEKKRLFLVICSQRRNNESLSFITNMHNHTNIFACVECFILAAFLIVLFVCFFIEFIVLQLFL